MPVPGPSLQVSFHLATHEAELRVCCHSSGRLVNISGNSPSSSSEFFNSHFSEDLLEFLGPQVGKCGSGNNVHIDGGRRASLRSTGGVRGPVGASDLTTNTCFSKVGGCPRRRWIWCGLFGNGRNNPFSSPLEWLLGFVDERDSDASPLPS